MQYSDPQFHDKVYWLQDNVLATSFPPLEKALREPDGLLAIGGTLSKERLLNAYINGIFPWYNQGQPIMWWSPNPRCILIPDSLKVSRSLKKRIKKQYYDVTYDTVFLDVMNQCAATRKNSVETWITNEMKEAYHHLFTLGYAHSVECWQDKQLVGGLYGIAMGKVFFGESMFSHRSDASKVALVHLTQQLIAKKIKLIDCQVHSKHLESLGAITIQRHCFAQLLRQHCNFEKTLF